MTLTVTLLSSGGRPVAAHPESSGSLPLRSVSIPLRHRSPADLVALFAREERPGREEEIPRAARADNAETLLPGETQALLRTRTPGELVIVAMTGAAELEAAVRLLDVPIHPAGPGREVVTVAPAHAPGPALRAAVLQLPGAGTATLAGGRLTLCGSPAWLHRALRCVLRAEFGVSPPALASPRRAAGAFRSRP